MIPDKGRFEIFKPAHFVMRFFVFLAHSNSSLSLRIWIAGKQKSPLSQALQFCGERGIGFAGLRCASARTPGFSSLSGKKKIRLEA
jgi:hypothetical protein